MTAKGHLTCNRLKLYLSYLNDFPSLSKHLKTKEIELISRQKMSVDIKIRYISLNIPLNYKNIGM